MTTAPPCPAPAVWPDWSGPTHQFAPETGPAGITAALAWLEALGERLQWPASVSFALTLCADEALANVAHHARTAQGAPARIWLTCGPTPAGVALCIEDDGTAFDPTAQASPQLAATLENAAIGGHGLRLMRHYLQQLSYRREQGRNRLLMEVARPPRA
ncbi:hypothetical protein C6568_11320 [Melaminivora suipulveris]|uniref:Histidine kinase/HSP90-like ATPase domain-containing protein n=1 Tax=Melaminivora suipulveris TaxID=2109913 RepID=A0A2R3QDC5_9BURK|nr:ATP-binding protein [Melaminivora suipulveris]AVO49778.1 hypothetical protein C6568_11320 [Melaminivora suipulveris]